MKRLTAVVVGFTLCIIAGQAFGLQLTSDISHNNIQAVNIDARPLCFTENAGQFGEKTLYKAEVGGAAFYFCQDEVAYLFVRDTDELLDDGRNDKTDVSGLPEKFNHPRYKQEAILVKAEFVGANQSAIVEGTNRLPHNNNYFIGNDHSQWHTDVANYAMVTYHDIYPGIDLKYYGDNRSMKYDFIVSPGADISQIRIHYEGVSDLSVTPAGDLQAQTEFGLVYEKVPYIYQEIAGTKQAVAGRYELIEPSVFGFAVDGAYDPNRPVVIDPELVYSTYIGTADIDTGNDIAVDADGNMFITGHHSEDYFPEVNPYEGDADNCAFVTKIAAAGDHLVFSTMIGGITHSDYGCDIAVDNSGYVYVTGYTRSTDFPLENALDSIIEGYEVFALKLVPEGNVLVYSTFLGGSDIDQAGDIACDLAGNAYVVGATRSPDFPTYNSIYQYEYSMDVFMAKISPDGSEWIYSILLPGSLDDLANSVAVDDSGYAYIAGETNSSDFRVTDNYDSSYNDDGLPPDGDAFVTKVSPLGDSLIFSNYLGGTAPDWATGLAIDPEKYIYVTGCTKSVDFPLVNPYDDTKSIQEDCFISKLSPDGNSLTFSTYLGGDFRDLPSAIVVDNAQNACIAGKTGSGDFPVVDGYFSSPVNQDYNIFLAKISTTSSCLLFSTYWGSGAADECANGIALNGENVYITGVVGSSGMPTLNPYDSQFNGGPDCFVTEFHVPEISVETGTITGTVTDEYMVAIEGVNIQLLEDLQSVVSDNSGAYALTDICPGTYDISISHPDHCDTTITGISLASGEVMPLDIILVSRGTLSGTVSDTGQASLDNVVITVEGMSISDTTGVGGEYQLAGFCTGAYDISFYKAYYVDTTVSNVEIVAGQNIELNVTLTPASTYVSIWYGNPDLTPVSAPVGGRAQIDVYAQTCNLAVSSIFMALASSDDYFDSYTNQPEIQFYYPISEWDIVHIFGPFNGSPSPEGYSSMGLLSWAWVNDQPAPYLISDVPTRIMTFDIDVVYDQSFIGDTVECLRSGEHPEWQVDLPQITDTLGYDWPGFEFFSPVTFIGSSGFAYLPGDANMPMAGWPPAVIGSDVTYMINYFRNLDSNPPCNFMGFYAPADINGDCRVIGSDVTRLVSYFRGQGTISYCPDYEPLWHAPQELPENPPSNWPGCEQE